MRPSTGGGGGDASPAYAPRVEVKTWPSVIQVSRLRHVEFWVASPGVAVSGDSVLAVRAGESAFSGYGTRVGPYGADATFRGHMMGSGSAFVNLSR